MTRLTSLLGNGQRLDGGSMFGNAPRTVWSRWLEPDEHHRVPLACRSLLIEEEGGRRILCEAGIGTFFEPKLRQRFGVEGDEHLLLAALAQRGLTPDDIDVIVLSHLHFDHAGGLLAPYGTTEAPTLLFPNAAYVVHEDAWQRAIQPHPRDRASYIPALQPLLEATGRLERVQGSSSHTLGEGYLFHLSYGHTPGLMLLEVPTPQGPVVFAGDLVPGEPWVHLPITMGYDRYPEKVIDEKLALYADLLPREGWLFFTHDPHVAMGRLSQDERGRYRLITPHAHLENWPS